MGAISAVPLIKKLRVKPYAKHWFGTEIISSTRKRRKLHSKCKKSGLETDKDKFESGNIFLQKKMHRKKSS